MTNSTNIPPPPDGSTDFEAAQYYRNLHIANRRLAHEALWRAADCFNNMDLSDGNQNKSFIKVLDEHKIPKSTAYKWMKIAKHFSLEEFLNIGSVNLAYAKARDKEDPPVLEDRYLKQASD